MSIPKKEKSMRLELIEKLCKITDEEKELLEQKKGVQKNIYSTRKEFVIDKQKMLIRGANILGKDGNNYNVSISQLKTDGVFKDSDFVFDPSKYKDVEIVDMR